MTWVIYAMALLTISLVLTILAYADAIKRDITMTRPAVLAVVAFILLIAIWVPKL